MAGCWKTEPNHRLNFKTILNRLMKSCSEDKQKVLLSENEIRIEDNRNFDNYLTSDLLSRSFHHSIIDH